MIRRADHGTGPPTYGKEKYVTGRSSGYTAQYEYIGRSIGRSWPN